MSFFSRVQQKLTPSGLPRFTQRQALLAQTPPSSVASHGSSESPAGSASGPRPTPSLQMAERMAELQQTFALTVRLPQLASLRPIYSPGLSAEADAEANLQRCTLALQQLEAVADFDQAYRDYAAVLRVYSAYFQARNGGNGALRRQAKAAPHGHLARLLAQLDAIKEIWCRRRASLHGSSSRSASPSPSPTPVSVPMAGRSRSLSYDMPQMHGERLSGSCAKGFAMATVFGRESRRARVDSSLVLRNRGRYLSLFEQDDCSARVAQVGEHLALCYLNGQLIHGATPFNFVIMDPPRNSRRLHERFILAPAATVKHSQLSRGEAVKYAGEVWVRDGRIHAINLNSGHYLLPHPTGAQRWFKAQVRKYFGVPTLPESRLAEVQKSKGVGQLLHTRKLLAVKGDLFTALLHQKVAPFLLRPPQAAARENAAATDHATFALQLEKLAVRLEDFAFEAP